MLLVILGLNGLIIFENAGPFLRRIRTDTLFRDVVFWYWPRFCFLLVLLTRSPYASLLKYARCPPNDGDSLVGPFTCWDFPASAKGCYYSSGILFPVII